MSKLQVMKMHTKLNLLLLLSIFWVGINGVAARASTSGVIISLSMIFITSAISQYLHIIPTTRKLKYNFLTYLVWLYYEVIKSTIDVIKRVWSKNTHIQPTFKWIDSGDISNAALTIYSNSITLTPGTLVLDIDTQKRRLLIHALNKYMISDLETRIMLEKIKKTIA